jgi:hypothetical protein
MLFKKSMKALLVELSKLSLYLTETLPLEFNKPDLRVLVQVILNRRYLISRIVLKQETFHY